MVELQIKQNLIDVTGIVEPNPNWSYECVCGEIITANNMPRQKFVKWEYYEGDRYPILSWHCKKCWVRVPDDEVAKSTRTSTHRQYTIGSTQYFVDGIETDKRKFKKKQKAITD